MQEGLAGQWHESGETFQGAERALLHRWGILARAQIGEIVGHQRLIGGTQHGQPRAGQGVRLTWGGL